MLAELYGRIDRMPRRSSNSLYGSKIILMIRASWLPGRRCLSSALQNQDLALALSDCNAALRTRRKTNQNYSDLFVDRGWCIFGKEITTGDADFDDALR